MAQDAARQEREEKREKEYQTKLEAEKKDAEAKAAKAALEKARKEEVSDAAEKAKEAAEKEAEDKAKQATADHEKALKEVNEKAEAAEKAQKAAEEESDKLKPTDDAKQPPIKFKDAVGRMFSFPWALCKTWKVSRPPLAWGMALTLYTYREWRGSSGKPLSMSK